MRGVTATIPTALAAAAAAAAHSRKKKTCLEMWSCAAYKLSCLNQVKRGFSHLERGPSFMPPSKLQTRIRSYNREGGGRGAYSFIVCLTVVILPMTTPPFRVGACGGCHACRTCAQPVRSSIRHDISTRLKYANFVVSTAAIKAASNPQ